MTADRAMIATAPLNATPPAAQDQRTRAGEVMPMPPAWAWALTLAGAGDRSAARGPSVGADQQVVVHHSSAAAVASASAPDAKSLSLPEFERLAHGLIVSSLDALAASGSPHAVRAWNFLPAINLPRRAALDRYRAFNLARHRAFSERFGEAAVRAGRMPTATCVGHAGDAIAVHTLGAPRPGTPVENPRQVPAFSYSLRHGPKPPCFARATIAQFGLAEFGPAELGRGPLVLIGGTASVRGEESVHLRSPSGQVDETFANLHSLLAAARATAHAVPGPPSPRGSPPGSSATPFTGVRAARVYHRHAADRPWLERRLAAPFAAVEVEFIRADICRAELLVEIELLADLRPRG